MYKVFLVDDEIVIREGIRNSFPWESCDFTLVGEAPDGEIALQVMQDVKPDILITDIRMPFRDGMQLCEAVSHTMPWVQIVILSGYDDFSYAQQAISLGVKEYLLKPVSAQELLEVLERIAGRIRNERRQQADILRIKRQFATNSAFLREKLLGEALEGVKGTQNVRMLLDRARSLNLSLLANRYLVMLVCPRTGEEKRALAQSALYRLADGSGDAVNACEVASGFALIVMGDNDGDLEERAYGFAQAAGLSMNKGDVYTTLFETAMLGQKDCGGLINVGYLSGEPVTGLEEGRPMMVRMPGTALSFANLARSLVYGAIVTLKIGMDILADEHVRMDALLGHGGFFKTPGTAQQLLAGALNVPVSVMATAGEGGPWGMALLAAYRVRREAGETLEAYLKNKVFAGASGITLDPDPADHEGFEAYTRRFTQALEAERAAVSHLK